MLVARALLVFQEGCVSCAAGQYSAGGDAKCVDVNCGFGYKPDKANCALNAAVVGEEA